MSSRAADVGAYAAAAAALVLILAACVTLVPRLVVRDSPAAIGWALVAFSLTSTGALLAIAVSTRQMSWFRFGLGENGEGAFKIAGVLINTRWQYCCVIVYQIVRCVLGCVAANVFRPEMLKLQGQLTSNTPEARNYLVWGGGGNRLPFFSGSLAEAHAGRAASRDLGGRVCCTTW